MVVYCSRPVTSAFDNTLPREENTTDINFDFWRRESNVQIDFRTIDIGRLYMLRFAKSADLNNYIYASECIKLIYNITFQPEYPGV